MSQFLDLLAESEKHPAGIDCPCCTQRVKLYRRHIHAKMGAALIKFYHARKVNDGWLHTKHLHDRGGDACKLAYWSLIEPRPGTRADGANRCGFWRITPRGVAFVERDILVPRALHVFNGSVQGISAEMTDIVTVLGKKFNYAKLMGHSL